MSHCIARSSRLLRTQLLSEHQGTKFCSPNTPRRRPLNPLPTPSDHPRAARLDADPNQTSQTRHARSQRRCQRLPPPSRERWVDRRPKPENDAEAAATRPRGVLSANDALVPTPGSAAAAHHQTVFFAPGNTFFDENTFILKGKWQHPGHHRENKAAVPAEAAASATHATSASSGGKLEHRLATPQEQRRGLTKEPGHGTDNYEERSPTTPSLEGQEGTNRSTCSKTRTHGE